MTAERGTGRPDRLDILYAADDAAESTIAESGGTFERGTLAAVHPAEGYAVGGLAPTIRLAYPATRADIARAILAVRDTFVSAPFVGTWADDVTSTVYVDAVVILPDLDSAGILARALGEHAVYAFAEGRAIPSEEAYAPRCAACGDPLNVTVRGHHHTEDGRDVTR